MARGGAGTVVGWLKFKVGADSSEFDSKIKSFKNKMEEADVKAKHLEKDMSDTKEIISNMTNLLNELNNDLLTEEEIIKKVNYLSENGFDISYNGNIKETTEQLKQMTELYLPGFQAILQEQEEQYKKINNQADLYKMKIKETESEYYNLSDITKRSLNSIGNSVEGVIKKFVKWGLAIVGIRSVMSFIRSSMSTLSQYDKQLATNLEYIRWALAQALKPLIEWVVKMIVTAIRLINTLIYKLFGVNLLASATPEKFKEAKNQLSKANDEVKELKKQLAGFDEMNILGDNTDKTSKTAEDIPTPSFDLSKLFTDKELNELMKKIKKKIDEIIDYIWKKWNASKFLNNALTDFFGAGLGIFSPNVMTGVVEGASKLGMDFVVSFKEGVTEYAERPSFTSLMEEKIITPIKEKIKKNPLFLDIKGLEFKDKDKEVKGAISSTQTEINRNPLKLSNIDTSKITSAFGGLPSKAKEAWTGITNAFGGVNTFFSNTFSTAWKGVLGVFNKDGKIFVGIKEALNGVFTGAVNGIFGGLDTVINNPFKEINGALNTLKGVKILGIQPFNFIKKNLIPTIKLPRLATGGIINMPGRGVALGGELGPEGVIPMTNKSAMELLGRTIGEYVTINANITNNMNGRLISRVLREVNAQQDFLYNR